MHGHGIGVLIRALDRLTGELSSSTRIVGVTDELRGVARARPRRASAGWTRGCLRLNAEEPYRLKAELHPGQAGRAPGTGWRRARRTSPGVDYLGSAELLAELALIGDSLRAHRGELVAAGPLA